MPSPTDHQEEALRMTGPCTCDVAYTSRKRIDPACRFHEWAEDIAQALSVASAAGERIATERQKYEDEMLCLAVGNGLIEKADAEINPITALVMKGQAGACGNCADAIRAAIPKEPE